eukprot:UN03729
MTGSFYNKPQQQQISTYNKTNNNQQQQQQDCCDEKDDVTINIPVTSSANTALDNDNTTSHHRTAIAHDEGATLSTTNNNINNNDDSNITKTKQSNNIVQTTVHRDLMLHIAQNTSTWLFRKPPQFQPGTLYSTLTLWWFKYMLYYQPFVNTIISIFAMICSLILLWCEVTIMFNNNNDNDNLQLSPLYYLAHIPIKDFDINYP